ncbi:histamine N-methyltransferase-like isoform X2 [Apostichopus japonicus]|uniref:histamine N-methyltransferase-like isoform X2 n=1 Tax=Stichopus japonicus TaxID=307972 RepID=UPI003AB5BBB1
MNNCGTSHWLPSKEDKMRTLKEHQYHRSLDEFLRRCDQEQVMLKWIQNNFSRVLDKIPSSLNGETTRFIGVGCGNGIMDVEMLKKASELHPRLHNIGIDPNGDALGVFKERVQTEPRLDNVNIEWTQETAEKYQNVPPKSFTKEAPRSHFIHMLHMLYHVSSIEGAIQKYYDMLVEGGVMLISLASRSNNQLYNTFKKFETLQSNQTNSSPIERNDKRYSDDVIAVLEKLGFEYSVESVEYRLDVSGCLERKTEGGKLLLDFVCLTNAAQSYETLSEENQRVLIDCLKESCTSTEDGKNHVKLTFDIITVVKSLEGAIKEQVNGIK